MESSKRGLDISILGTILSRIESWQEILRFKYCSTKDMIADYMSKPSQGKKFIKFRKLDNEYRVKFIIVTWWLVDSSRESMSYIDYMKKWNVSEDSNCWDGWCMKNKNLDQLQ